MSRGSRALDAHIDDADGGPATGRYQPAAPPGFQGGRPLAAVTTHRLENPPHWHVVTYGLSEMEYKETDDPQVSGWGFELSLRVAGDEEPMWAVDLLNSLAGYVWTSAHPFAPGHHVDLGGAMRLGAETRITAAAAVTDPVLGSMVGPFGALEFVQLVGLTADELEACRSWSTEGMIELLRRRDPLLVTDLARRSILEDPEAAAEIASRRGADGSSLTELRVGTLDLRARLGRVRAVMGAGAATALGPALRRELIGEGARFSVVGDRGRLHFVVQPQPSWTLRGSELTVGVPLGEVAALSELFSGRTGWGRRPAWPRLRFHVVP